MYALVNYIVRILKIIVPETVVELLRPLYHRMLAYGMAFSYGFPARSLTVIGVTGTKGKSTTAEMLFSVLRAAGYKTALLSTIRFAIENDSEPNRYKMTLPGRGFAQTFMRKALATGCTHVVIEITSESVLQYRHWFLDLDGLIVTNVQREHIERHGSFEKYVEAKHSIVDALVRSPKRSRVLVTNGDLPETHAFISARVSRAIAFSAHELRNLSEDERNVGFDYNGVRFSLPVPGAFNAMNALAAVKLTEALGIPLPVAASALAVLPPVRGRVEHIDAGQDFLAVVDYAHTSDAMLKLLQSVNELDHNRIITVFGCGGDRDRTKRPIMGQFAEENSDCVIVTSDNPRTEDPNKIIEDIIPGMKMKNHEIEADREKAIMKAYAGMQPPRHTRAVFDRMFRGE